MSVPNHSSLGKVISVYLQNPGTGDDGTPTGSCEAQLSAGYICISETKWVTTHSPPLSINEDF